MKLSVEKILEVNPIIAAIKDLEGLDTALKSNCRVIFVLFGNLLNIGEIVDKLKKNNKIVFADVDLIDGLSNSEVSIKYLKQYTKIDGILSTKASNIKAAKLEGLLTIHRLFLVDSFAYHNVEKQVSNSQPDFIQILPGAMPKVISWVVERVKIPIIAGGLVCEKEDVYAALKAGAIAIVSSNPEIWFI
jgi:glycerol uptake operon antiterminator